MSREETKDPEDRQLSTQTRRTRSGTGRTTVASTREVIVTGH